MAKFKRFLFLYILFLTLSIILYSCCKNPEVELYAVERVVALDQNSTEIDTVKESFSFEVYFKYQDIASSSEAGLLNSAYATTCPTNYSNTLSSAGFEMSCDQDFIYKNDTIRAGSELSALPELDVLIDSGPFVSQLQISVTDSFLNHAQFTKGNHLFNFKMQTSDDKNLQGNLSLFMDL